MMRWICWILWVDVGLGGWGGWWVTVMTQQITLMIPPPLIVLKPPIFYMFFSSIFFFCHHDIVVFLHKPIWLGGLFSWMVDWIVSALQFDLILKTYMCLYFTTISSLEFRFLKCGDLLRVAAYINGTISKDAAKAEVRAIKNPKAILFTNSHLLWNPYSDFPPKNFQLNHFIFTKQRKSLSEPPKIKIVSKVDSVNFQSIISFEKCSKIDPRMR